MATSQELQTLLTLLEGLQPGSEGARPRTYAGIGSRETPDEIQDVMTRVARHLATRAFTLQSGGAVGADRAFERGADEQKTIFYGNARHQGVNGYENVPTGNGHVLIEDGPLAERAAAYVRYGLNDNQHWRNIERKPFTRNLMRRNAFQVLGADLRTPVDLVICYAPYDGDPVLDARGGTRAAVLLANRLEIPIYNLAAPNAIERLAKYLDAGCPERRDERRLATARALDVLDAQFCRALDAKAFVASVWSVKPQATTAPAAAAPGSLPLWEQVGNMWDYAETLNIALCVTTNGVVGKDGRAVMGAGIALEAKTRYPGIDEELGQHLRTHGNHVVALQTAAQQGGPVIIAFPTKNDWRNDADVTLITQSCRELRVLIDSMGLKNVVLPRPGVGHGRLDWETQVKPVLERELGGLDAVVVLSPPARAQRLDHTDHAPAAKATSKLQQSCHPITIGNANRGDRGEYIGRGGMQHFTPSPLANPYRIGSIRNGATLKRGDSIPLYQTWLREQIDAKNPAIISELTRLATLAKQGPVTLVCHCAPDPCHGDVVKETIERALARQQTKAKDRTMLDHFSDDPTARIVDVEGPFVPGPGLAPEVAVTIATSSGQKSILYRITTSEEHGIAIHEDRGRIVPRDGREYIIDKTRRMLGSYEDFDSAEIVLSSLAGRARDEQERAQTTARTARKAATTARHEAPAL